MTIVKTCSQAAAIAGWCALAFWQPATAQDPSAGGCSVSGVVSAQRTALPGAVLSLIGADGRAVDVTSSGIDGSFTLRARAGDYKLTAQLTAFARIERDVKIDAASCAQRVDLTMTLASRVAAAAAASTPAALPAPVAAARGGRGFGGGFAGRGGRGQNAQAPQQFQSLELVADQAGLNRAPADEAGAATDAASQILLPPGFSAESSAESVTAVGTASQAQTFFGGANGPADFAQRFGDAFGGAAAFGGNDATQAGAAGPGPGGRGGFGPNGGFAGRGGRGNNNQIRGNVSQNFDTSALDTAPYALNGTTSKPDYLQQRFTGTIGGPLVIPKVVNSPRTFFFVNYTGNHSRNPFDQYSTVPTIAEREGDLSALEATIIDPRTGRPFAGNQIPSSRLDSSAQALLGLVPLPNQPGATQNFHTVTTSTSQLDDINVRVIRTFGAQPQRGRGGFGGRGFGGGRGGAGRAGASNLNVTIHFRHSDNSAPSAFPALSSATRQTAWDTPIGYSFTRNGLFHQLRFDFNRQHGETANAFGNSVNIAGNAGLLGIAADPFDWGAPNLSFSTFASLRDTNPSTRTDRTLSFGDTVQKTKGRHSIRFGGDYRDIRADSRTDANARGSFVFSGLYSGVDFADFLLGLPQQATVQYGPGLERFRSNSWDLFVQDDWRATDKVTVNAGLRYEYYSPVSEAGNRLVTLDAPSNFTAAVPVVAGNAGPFSGTFSDTIVNPFRAGFAPRVGLAWRPKQGLVIRPGYSINYNAGVYQAIAQQLAGQPPFAVTDTAIGTLASPLLLSTALVNVSPNAVNNTYGVDPNYRLGFVQIWSLDVQKDITRTIQAGVAYTGTKGANLDFLRAPNRGPSGLLIAGVAPFIWESSGADSLMNSISLRLRKRMTSGFAAGGTYTLSKATDNASSIGGGGGTVAQNDRDLEAERGLSSFDQRHRVAGDFTFELPFGANKPWLKNGAAAELFGNWVVNGNVQFASGTPLTARVLGAAADVARGVNGTLRANYNGAPIAVSDPTTLLFFNTSAFSIPPAGTFGTAGRNTIIGPGTSVVNMSLTRNLTFGATRGLAIQIQANNIFNTVQFAAVDTVVNSPTFGQITGVRPLRRVQITTRFRF